MVSYSTILMSDSSSHPSSFSVVVLNPITKINLERGKGSFGLQFTGHQGAEPCRIKLCRNLEAGTEVQGPWRNAPSWLASSVCDSVCFLI